MSLLNFAYLWTVVLVVSATLSAPFVIFGWRRAQWQAWELAGFIVPLGLWFALVTYGVMPKSMSNFWIEVIRLTAALPIAAGLRVVLPRIVSPRLLAVTVQVCLCLFAVGTYLFTPFLPK